MTTQKRRLSRKAAAAGLILLAAAVVLAGVLWLRSRSLPAYLKGETGLFSPVFKPSGLEDRSYFLAGDRYLLRLDSPVIHPCSGKSTAPRWVSSRSSYVPFPKGRKPRPVALEAAATGAALPVLPVVDTLKRVREGRVVETLDRQELGAAQTPQGFHYPLLVEACESARVAGLTLTDEAMAVERLGHAVSVVAGSPRNRKITTPDDLAWAEGVVAGILRA